jgi:hypothetical protein
MDKNVCGDDLDLNELQLLTGDELFLTIDHTSQLGRELVAFGAGIETSKAKIQECKKFIVTSKENIKEMQENDLENKTSRTQVLIAELIEGNTNRITLSKINITDETEKVRKSAMEIEKLIIMISLAHENMRNKITYVKAIGFPATHDTMFTQDLIDLVSEEEKADLLLLQEFVADIFEHATKTNNATQVKATTSAILSWTKETQLTKSKYARRSLTQVLTKRNTFARPPTDSDNEVTADQPILQAVICRIIGILASSNKEKEVLHNQDDGVTTEQSNVENTKDRRIDITVSPREEHLALVLPTMAEKTIEIKTARDDAVKFKKALKKGRSQIVGHLGKRLMYAFDFGGAGKDGRTLGVSLTHLSIEVIKMNLAQVGTGTVSLDMSTTGCVPLFGKELLTGTQCKEFVSLDTNGILLLAGALKHRTPEEFDLGASLTQVEPIFEDLKHMQYLGSGAFSNVVGFHSSGDFIKMPKSAALATSLEQEAAILRKLESIPPSSSIPIIASEISISTLRAVIRGEISTMIGLRLHGVVGVTLDRLPSDFWSTHSNGIITTVYQALEFAHKKNIYHLDVRPENIFVDVKPFPFQVMLSDWGCSVEGTTHTTLTHFRGCTPYAHDRLLGEAFTGQLDKDLDFASLTYTIHHVCAGKLKWSFPFDDPSNISIQDLEYRRQSVDKWLKSEEFKKLVPQNILENLKTACCITKKRTFMGMMSFFG